MGRPRKVTRVLASVEEAQEALRKYKLSMLTTEQLDAAREEAKTAIDERYGKQISLEVCVQKELHAQLEAYWNEHKPSGDAAVKHLELVHGVIGSRREPEVLKPANKAWNWKEIFAAVRTKWPGRFVSQAEPQLDREALRKAGFSADELREVGLKTFQGEKFYIDLDRSKECGL